MKDINYLMNEIMKKEKAISLSSLAPKLARLSPHWGEYYKDRIQGFLIEDYFKILESSCKDGGNNEKSYLEERYSIKSIEIEEAIKQVYKNNIEVVFNESTKKLYPEYKFIFYKDKTFLQKYIKAHTKLKPITAIFCDL